MRNGIVEHLVCCNCLKLPKDTLKFFFFLLRFGFSSWHSIRLQQIAACPFSQRHSLRIIKLRTNLRYGSLGFRVVLNTTDLPD